MCKMRLLLFSLFSVIATSSSKCPETRKPHVTSCAIFYNCVNLPGGGYVWVPSRCTDGLVFQPYLRMCVLPGDTWTCDTLSTESSLLINKNVEDSYLGYTQDPSEFTEFIDSSYAIDDNEADASNQPAFTAYPLIRVTEPAQRKNDKNMKDVGIPMAIDHKEKTYLYEYVNSRQEIPFAESLFAMRDRYTWLRRLINSLLIYKEAAENITTMRPNEYTSNRQNNILLNYLAQTYIQKNDVKNIISVEDKFQNTTQKIETSITQNVDADDPEEDKVGDSKINISKLLSNSPQAANSIILIVDDFGNKQYLTIDRYKSVVDHLVAQSIILLPCTKNARLPNNTDCARYYTCDPKTAIVREYSCPISTAFNEYTRICDIQSFKGCYENNYQVQKTSHIKQTERRDDSRIKVSEKLCEQVGKLKDPVSDSHYYICYSPADSADVKAVRMMCPNDLIFCQNRKVCTTKSLCKT